MKVTPPEGETVVTTARAVGEAVPLTVRVRFQRLPVLAVADRLTLVTDTAAAGEAVARTTTGAAQMPALTS